MNNIYDIISEQKILVDMNTNRYEINAIVESTLTYLREYEYVEEGLSDIANKIINFIKTMMAKLRELVNKILNYFKGTAEKKGDITQAAVNKAKKESGKEITKEDIFRIVKGSQKKVTAIKYAKLDVKENVGKAFLNAVYSASELYMSDIHEAKDRFRITILKKAFKGNGKYNSSNKELGIVDRAKLEINEPKEAQEYKVSDLADEIISYSVEIKAITDNINKLHKTAEDSLKRFIVQMENKEVPDQASVSQIQGVVTMIGQFTNYICTSIVTAYNQYEKIALEAVDHYYENGGKDTNQQKEQPKPNNEQAKEQPNTGSNSRALVVRR